MATATSRTQAAADETMSKAINTFTQNMAPNLESLMNANAEAGRVWMDHWNNINQELVDFANTRLSHNMEVIQQMSSCRDPFQVMQLQTECFQTASKQYMDEIGKLADMATEAGVNCFKQLDEGLRTAAERTEGRSKAA